jgi:hypothetical protein
MGRSIINTASNTGGRIPEIIPTTTSGRSQIHARKESVVQRVLMLDTKPTKATGVDRSEWVHVHQKSYEPGIDQKMMSAAVAA